MIKSSYRLGVSGDAPFSLVVKNDKSCPVRLYMSSNFRVQNSRTLFSILHTYTVGLHVLSIGLSVNCKYSRTEKKLW